jgi:pullulanase, type I
MTKSRKSFNERELLIRNKMGKEWREIFNSKEFDEEFYYDGNDLGANYSKEKTVFKVWAPTAEEVSLNLYNKGSEEEKASYCMETFSMKLTEKGVWMVKVEGDLNGTYYTYTVTANGIKNETGDIYAKACGVNGIRSMVVNLEKTNPCEWEEDKHVFYPLEETEIWEVHIGDFSNDPNSGITPKYQGKYLAFTEENTTLRNDKIHPTCLNYLKNLGITHVQLLPAFDYGSVDEGSNDGKFNWGYDPINYNVPEGSYSTNPFKGEVRIREYKQMIAALHKTGISVVMDVVYNHTYSLDSHFNRTVPYYYYRQDEEGNYCDGSACSNDTASDRKMFQKYMVESVLYWVKEYHIDGFRFDLMGLHDTETMNLIREEIDKLEFGKNIIIYGEPWSATDSAFKEGYIPAKKESVLELKDRISIFNDDTRDAIKGAFNELESPGFVNGGIGFEKKIKRAVCGLIDVKYKNQPKTPGQLINYVSAHDNSTLWDKLVDSVKKDGDYFTKHEELLAMNKLAAAIVQFSKGIPFMQAGEEAGRTKLGEDNSFCLSKELNQLDWERIYEFEELTNYYKGIIKVRKSFKGFNDLSENSAENIAFMKKLPKQVVAYKIKGIYEESEWKEVIVIFNASNRIVEINLDGGKWELLVDGKNADEKGIMPVKEYLVIPPISACVIGKKKMFKL